MAWAFDGYVLDPARRELRQGRSRIIDLEPQVFDVLVYVIQHRDHVVSKEELFGAVWKGRIVSDSALTTRINAARRAIGDDGKSQRLIRTVQGKGVRFVGAVEETPVGEGRLDGSGARHGLVGVEPKNCSVGVLRFQIGGEGKQGAGFADALYENLVAALSLSGRLTVTELADSKLGERTRFVVRGHVYQRDDRLRVIVRCLHLTTGVHLWVDRFESPVEQELALIDRVVAVAAGCIDLRVQEAEVRRQKHRPSRHPDAYDLYRQAQPIFSFAGKQGIVRSLSLLEQAVRIAPDFAAALADAALCLQNLDINGWASDRALNRARAVEHARRALSAESDPQSMTTAAHVLVYFGEEVEVALAEIDRALALNPFRARGWFAGGMARLMAGQLDQAAAYFAKATALDPRDRLGRRSLAGAGIIDLCDGRLDAAVSRLRLAVNEFPHWATPYCALAAAYAQLGHEHDAVSVGERMRTADPTIVPTFEQFKKDAHRELLASGLKSMRV